MHSLREASDTPLFADQERTAQAAIDSSHEAGHSGAWNRSKRPTEPPLQAGHLQQRFTDLAAAREIGPSTIPQVQAAALRGRGLWLGLCEQEPG